MPAFETIVGSESTVLASRLSGEGPDGPLPITEEMLLSRPSGTVFGLTQNAGMGWNPAKAGDSPFLILTTQGGLRSDEGRPQALGYHTGHWELGMLVAEAARTFRNEGALPFAAYCTDPCDGRTQGTLGMMDSLPYRNDAAIVARRLIRSLPDCAGVLVIATCDKGLPAMMQGLVGCPQVAGIVLPGGVTLPARGAEDAGTIQSVGARFAHGVISLEYAADMSCRACGSSGGGCQFLGTAASAQIVAESLGLALPHSALSPSGEAVWKELAVRSSKALVSMKARNQTLKDILSVAAFENAMLVHAAFGGSTNILLHLPAIAHSAGLPIPRVEDWIRANRSTPRLVDALPNGPRNHPTVQVFMAGAVPEVMLHLRRLGLLNLNVPTVSGHKLNDILDCWEESPRRRAGRKRLQDEAGVKPADVILSPDRAVQNRMTGTVVFPTGNLAPEGSVVKATSIDPSLTNQKSVYRHRGPVRFFASEVSAMQAIKTGSIKEGDVLVLAGIGPLGTGMEEIYQITSALKFLPWGKSVTVLTDGRFSGVSTGACVGHIGPEALAGGPIGKLRDGDVVEVEIDRQSLTGSINLVASDSSPLSTEEASQILRERETHPDLRPHPDLPADTRLWAALQQASGGTWKGAVYDADRILKLLEAGERALKLQETADPSPEWGPESAP